MWLLWLQRGLRADGRHKSIIAYLSANDLPGTAAALRQELDLGEDVLDNNTVKKYEGLLEKKWTSVVRLQKKVQHELSSRDLSPQDLCKMFAGH